MHVFCSYSCAVQREIVPQGKATTCVFLGYAQSGYRCYDVKSKRLEVSLNVLFNDIASYFPLPNSSAPGENGDGDVLRPSPVHQLEPHSSAVDVTDQPHSSGQQLCPASSADCQPVQLTSEDSSHVTRHSMFILGGDYSLFPRVRLLQKIRSLPQSLPQIQDPSLWFVDPLKYLIPLKDFFLLSK